MESEEEAHADGFTHSTPESYNYDPVESTWEGWMYVGKIPESSDLIEDPSTDFVKITSAGLFVYNTEEAQAEPLHEFFNKDLELPCESSGCFKDDFAATQTGKSDAEVQAAQLQLDKMAAKIKDDKACRVFGWTINGKKEYFNFCTIKTDGDETFINAFNGLAMELYKKVNEIKPISATSVPEDGFEVSASVVVDGNEGQTGAKKSVDNLVFESSFVSIKDSSETLFEYKDIDECFMCFHDVEIDASVQ